MSGGTFKGKSAMSMIDSSGNRMKTVIILNILENQPDYFTTKINVLM